MSTGTGDSILQPVDIPFTVAYHITGTVRVLICQLSNFAILNYDIIEREVFIMLFMCLTVPVAESASIWSTMLREVLSEILLDGLTTMLLPCTLVQGNYIIAHLFDSRNS